MERQNGKNLLGINGAGRIGKLTLWNHILNKHFGGIVVNVGRNVGKNLEALIHESSEMPLHNRGSRNLP